VSTSSSSIALSRFSFGQHFAGKTNKWKRSRKTGRLGGRGGGRTDGGGGGGIMLQRETGIPEQIVCIAGHSNMYTTHSTVTHTHTHHTATHNTHKHNYNSENCPEMELVYIFSTASRLKFGRTSNYKASVVTGGFITTLRRFRPKCVLRTRRNCKYEKSSHGAFQTTCTINTVQSRFTRRRQFHHPSHPPTSHTTVSLFNSDYLP
jgi:hypothetical protein